MLLLSQQFIDLVQVFDLTVKYICIYTCIIMYIPRDIIVTLTFLCSLDIGINVQNNSETIIQICIILVSTVRFSIMPE